MSTSRNAPPVVQTRFGTIDGESVGDLHVFKAVPYAEPPVGGLRFKAPRPLQPWSGLRHCGPAAPASMQMNAAIASRVSARIQALDPGVKGILPWPSYVKDAYAISKVSEDCLYLSIWAPPTEPGEKLPVYIYFHGGANAVSSGSIEVEDGANFAREKRVVVVKPNYRLGALGWVHFGLLNDSQDMAEAINLGLQDQIAALEWVHENIEAFGGDRANITVGGESAGATAVSHFLTHPRARQFFKRAIVQSFTPFNNWCTSPASDSQWVAREYLRLLGCESSSELVQAPAEDLLAVQNIMTRRYPAECNVAWRPLGAVVDGVHVSDFPAQVLTEGAANADGPELIIGFAKDEWQFFRGHAQIIEQGTLEQVIEFLGQIFSNDHARLLVESFALLPRNQNKDWGQVLSDIMSFLFFKLPSHWVAQNLSCQGIPVRVYQFSYDLPGEGGRYRALHTGNLPFLWLNISQDRLAKLAAFDGIDLTVAKHASETMVDFYCQFLQGRPPKGWERFEAADHKVLWFGQELYMQPGMLNQELGIMQQIGLTKFSELNAKLQDSLNRVRHRV
jgi:para-nitrobenzyl esterase